MGIYSRDYIRDDESPYGRRTASMESWKLLMIITVVVFVLQLLTRFDRGQDIQHSSLVGSWLDLAPGDLIYRLQVWRLVTYGFCHDIHHIEHILFNMLALWMFGRVLEPILGSREFVALYLASIVAAGLAYVGLALAMGDSGPVLGASGATIAVLAVFGMMYPRQIVHLFGVFPVEARWLVIAFIFYDSFPIIRVLGGGRTHDTIAHSAHLGGLAFGIAYQKLKWRLSDILEGLKRPSFDRLVGRRSKIRIHKPSIAAPEENLDDQVDAILEKISSTGESSLNDRERDVLKRASQRYKNR